MAASVHPLFPGGQYLKVALQGPLQRGASKWHECRVFHLPQRLAQALESELTEKRLNSSLPRQREQDSAGLGWPGPKADHSRAAAQTLRAVGSASCSSHLDFLISPSSGP